jgi:hypothetical protein
MRDNLSVRRRGLAVSSEPFLELYPDQMLKEEALVSAPPSSIPYLWLLIAELSSDARNTSFR